jgi:hypothetical protein
MRILGIVALGVALSSCEKPDPEQVEFDKKFDRDAVLVKTCRDDPTIAGGSPMRVYRFQDKLWFLEYKRRWRQIDAKPDNVCDLLDTDAAHRATKRSSAPSPSRAPLARALWLRETSAGWSSSG